jgi:hypothetical protein
MFNVAAKYKHVALLRPEIPPNLSACNNINQYWLEIQLWTSDYVTWPA